MELTNSRKLDQFYTCPHYALEFYNNISNLLLMDEYDIILEPSAGDGSFYNLLDERRIGIDIDPKIPGLIKSDFFEWNYPIDKNILTIGNPPFGKNSSLAIRFFNHAAKFSSVIAFIIPRTFRKTSVINRLDRNFHLLYDSIVPDNSFIFDGNCYDVPCCAQIWIKKDHMREKIPTYKLSYVSKWWEVVDASESDFLIQRVGARAGLIRTTNYTQFSKESNYFIKAHYDFVLEVFLLIDFESVKHNTAGNPSISANELISLWIDKAKELKYL